MLPIDPSMFAGLSQLGLGTPEVTGNAGIVDNPWQIAADDMKKQLDDAVASMNLPAPGKSSMKGDVIRGGIAAIIGGLTGAGVQASAPAAESAMQTSGAMREERDAAALQAHTEKLKGAADYLKMRDDMSKRMLMILQAQPDILQSEQGPLISEIAFYGLPKGVGLQLDLDSKASNASKGLATFAKQMRDDTKDPNRKLYWGQVEARALNLPVEPKLEDFDQNGGLTPQYILENLVSYPGIGTGKNVADHVAKGGTIDIGKGEWLNKDAHKFTYEDQILQDTLMLGRLVHMEKLSIPQAMKRMPADAALRLDAKFGEGRTRGELGFQQLVNLTSRMLTQGGDMARIVAGGMTEQDYNIVELNKEMSNYRASSAEAAYKDFQLQITNKQLQLEKSGMSPDAAEAQAIKEVTSQAQSSGGDWYLLSDEQKQDLLN